MSMTLVNDPDSIPEGSGFLPSAQILTAICRLWRRLYMILFIMASQTVS
jgi:hypothetical protein